MAIVLWAVFMKRCVDTKEMAFRVTLKCRTLDFVERFRLCEMDEVDFILGNTFSKIHKVDMKRKPMLLVVCYAEKNISLKLTKTCMTRGGTLNFLSMDQMKSK